jgi:anti-sigma factor (TIGR02949 family)
MDCRELQRFVHIYLDDELDEHDRGEIEGHLAACDACRAQTRFERWFRAGIRRTAPVLPPPPDLRARICAELAKAPASRSGDSLRRWSVPLAATLAVGGLTAYLVAPERGPALPMSTASEAPRVAASAATTPAPSPAAPSNAHVAAASSIGSAQKPTSPAPVLAQHTAPSKPAPRAVAAEPRTRPRSIGVVAAAAKTRAPDPDEVDSAPGLTPASPPTGERDLGLQFASSSPDRVRTYLEERLERRLSIPTFRGRARVLGGSASAHDSTAQVLYRYRGDTLYLHVRTRRDPTLPPRGIVVRQEDGHQVAAWQQGGLTFSMTSRLDPVEMVRLVAGELSDVRRTTATASAARAPAASMAPDENLSLLPPPASFPASAPRRHPDVQVTSASAP